MKRRNFIRGLLFALMAPVAAISRVPEMAGLPAFSSGSTLTFQFVYTVFDSGDISVRVAEDDEIRELVQNKEYSVNVEDQSVTIFDPNPPPVEISRVVLFDSEKI